MARARRPAGASLRAVLYGGAVFVLVLAICGAGIVVTVRRAAMADLRDGLEATLAVVEESAAVVDESAAVVDESAAGAAPEIFAAEMADLARTMAASRLALAVHSEGGLVAANAALAPMTARWHMERQVVTTRGDVLGPVLVLSARIGPYAIVLGRDAGGVVRLERALVAALAVAGIVVLATLLGIGLAIDRGTDRALRRIAGALDRVSRGDLASRAPVASERDQIDRVARQINIHLDRLERMVEETRLDAAAIAHDLRTPLTRATLAAGRVIDGAAPALRPDAEALADELDRLGRICDAILGISRISSRAEPLQAAPVDLVEIVRDVADLYAAPAEEAGQRLTVSAEPAQISGDRAMLTQAAANLLANALTHAGPDAELYLACGTGADGPVLICSDTGPGIAERDRARLLDPFQRGGSGAGNGLGLSLVRAVVERHGARLTLSDNRPGLRVEIVFLSDV